MHAPQPLLPDVDFAWNDVPDLHELIDRTRESGTVVPVTYHGRVAWLINGYRELRQAFHDEEHFMAAASYREIAEPSMGRTLQTMTGEEHRINRMLVSRPFLPKQVRRYIEWLIEPEANRLLDAVDAGSEVDLVEAFTRRFPFSVITRLLGVPVDDDEKLLTWAIKLIDYPWDPEGALRARREFEDYLRPIVHRRRVDPGEDIISLLASAEEEGEALTDEEIFAFCLLLFPAGSDTTYKNLGSQIYALLTVPGLWQRAAEGTETVARIVEEGARWESPVALLPRACSRDTELGGVALEAGTPVLFGIAAANNDPSVFDDPRRFNPDRQGRSLAFGNGVHVCLGRHLAQREMETALTLLRGRFPHMRLAPGAEPEIVGGVLRGPRELRVRPRG